jgi:hypothetical protein
VIDVVELFQHWHAGRRIGELSSSLGLDPKTVRKYLKPAIDAGIVPGGPPLGVDQWAGLAEGWFPELVDPSRRQTTWPEIAPHHDRIKAWIGAVTIATMHQRLRDDHGLGASESSVRRYISSNFEEEVARAAVRVLRDTPPPGQEVQVDYGLLGRWFDPAAGRVRRVQGFIMVLAFSRLIFLRPVLSMDERSWVESHVAAFEFFGGGVARIVPDNLKTGVIKPDLYDPLINKAFGEFADHYGCLIDPARVVKPRDGPGGTFRPLLSGLVLRRTGGRVHRPRPHAGRCPPVVSRGGQPTSAPGPRSGRPPGALRGRGTRPAPALAPFAVRTGQMVEAQGPTRHPRQGGQDPLQRAVDPHRQGGRRP